ncbi:MAG: putative porin [Pseudomonadales bacterium]|jgi:hypothetical protein
MPPWFDVSRRLLLGLSVLMTTPMASGATADEETIAALQAQVAALTARLDALEERRQVPIEEYRTPVATSRASSPGWTDRIKLSGDFRYRHESIDAASSDTRHRNRIRARPALTAKVTDSVDVGLGLATGGDSPTSANQTLGESFTKKPIALDLAYFSWDTPVDGLNVTGGKYKNPLFRPEGNGLIWDSDLRPEGMNVNYAAGGLTLTGLMNWVTESSGSDNVIFGGQARWAAPMGEDRQLIVGAGYYDLSTLKGKPVPYDGDPRGNSVTAGNEYLNGYEELELFGQLKFALAGRPTTFFVDYVQNLDASRYDQGWMVGASMDFMHGKRPWSLGYAYETLEPDAVFAMVTDSDFIGGGTNGRGHIFHGSYRLTENVALGGTLLITERGGYGPGEWEDYNRLMLDIQFKY